VVWVVPSCRLRAEALGTTAFAIFRVGQRPRSGKWTWSKIDRKAMVFVDGRGMGIA
jgi:hypothetical protein